MTTSAGPGGPRVDNEGIVFDDPRPLPPMDVVFDGHRVWSVDPERDGRGTGDGRMVSWPSSMRQFLNGYARVQIREHVGNRPHFDATVKFGTGSGTVRFVDSAGNLLTLNKAGIFVRDFSHQSDQARTDLISRVRQTLDALSRLGNVPAFLCYGLLLGAVREGQMLAHDDDGDVGYLSEFEHPVDVMLESYELERAFHRRGWTTQRMSGGTFKVFSTSPNGGRIGIDVFAAFYLAGTFHLMGFVRGQLERSELLPLGSVTLDNQQLAAPARPEALLALTYGPAWTVPDPAFKFVLPAETERRFTGWLRGDRPNRRWWIDFHHLHPAATAPLTPSDFARHCSTSLGDELVLDVGCGQGRDAVWLNLNGHSVLGLDYAPSAIKRAKALATSVGGTASFRHLNLNDTRETLVAAARLVREHRGARSIVARWLLDSLDDNGRRNFLTFARMVLQGPQGRLHAEVRLVQRRRAAPLTEFAGQWQALLSIDQLREEIVERGGHIESCERLGRADEEASSDPPRCRLVVTWEK